MVNELSARSPSPPRLLTSPRGAIHGPLLRSLAWNQEWGFTFPDRALRRHAVQCPFSEACWISELREASMRDHATPFGFRDFFGLATQRLSVSGISSALQGINSGHQGIFSPDQGIPRWPRFHCDVKPNVRPTRG